MTGEDTNDYDLGYQAGFGDGIAAGLDQRDALLNELDDIREAIREVVEFAMGPA
jgi:hypothetical protein